MKKTYILLAVLLAVCTAFPAVAQTRKTLSDAKDTKITNQVTRSIARAARAHRKQHQPDAPLQKAKQDTLISPICVHCGNIIEMEGQRCPDDPDMHCMPASESDAKAHTCYRCGKRFREGQHCSAADYNALCANSPEQERQLEQAEQERKAAAEKARHCPKCGEEYSVDEIYHGEKHVCDEPQTDNAQKKDSSSLTEIDPGALHQAEALLQADRDAHSGYPEHTLEYYYQQVISAK